MKNLFFLFLLFLVSKLFAGITIVNGLTHIHDAKPGDKINGTIVIKNINKEDSERVSILLKHIDQTCGKEGNYVDPKKFKRSIVNWISFNTTEKVIRPGRSFNLKYTIKIPKTYKDLPLDFGSFWNTVLIQGNQVLSENTTQGVTINSKVRYGVQLIVNLGKKTNPELTFEQVRLSKYKDDVRLMQVKVENLGNFMVKPEVLIQLFNEDGTEAFKTNANIRKLYPNGCRIFNVYLEGVPKGKYEGVLVADYGSDIFGINLTLNIE